MKSAELTYKICVFGEGSVGKTTLVRRYLTGIFEQDLKVTMGAEIFVKYLEIENKEIVLQIWDFGGEESFRFLLPLYAKGSHGGIFIYDVTRYSTLRNLSEWLEIFKGNLNEGEEQIPIIIVGNKSDLSEQRSVSSEDAIDLVKSYNLHDYFESSAKNGQNIEKLFETLTRLIMKNLGVI